MHRASPTRLRQAALQRAGAVNTRVGSAKPANAGWLCYEQCLSQPRLRALPEW